jgi:SpoVK/Ycf46/Vps4 family AAA+-type ATPase
VSQTPESGDIPNALAGSPAGGRGDTPAAKLPAWYPAWAKELADLYFSGTTCLFVLHGNVHDLVSCPEAGEDGYCSIPDFLTTQVFGNWDLVVGYDLSRGLRPQAGRDDKRLRTMQQHLTGRWGELGGWPREPDAALQALDALVERNLVEEAASRKSMAVVFDYAQYLVPAGDLDSLARGQAARLVRFLRWAQNPLIKQVNMAFCLVADRLAELSDRLVESPHVAAIEVPLPGRDERCRFSQWATRGEDFSRLADFPPEQLAEMSNGLSLVNLNVVLSQARRTEHRVDQATFRQLKKTSIERQCRGLVEFVEPDHTLDLVAGQGEAKKRLQEDAKWICQGELDAAPMGYLICGPVGTGKTFLAECYAGSIGIPCVSLKNFRSKYVGETEGNLQQVLTVLRSLGPVVVVIDEADAALGNRQADGDSGTSARVFSMIAAQMGNTQYRGRIMWFLLTCRPDLLPIDIKRQGRCEVHIPLFYPHEPAEISAMFLTMAKKNRIDLAADALPEIPKGMKLSGADVEGIVTRARREALIDGDKQPTKIHLQRALDEFLPSVEGDEKELQVIAATLECTDRDFLPEQFRTLLASPEGRSGLLRKYRELRASLG